MLDWLKRLFGSERVRPDPLWQTMEKMDPLLSWERFQALPLTEQQRPLVKGLIEGSLKPVELEAVARWAAKYGEADDGIDALVFGLQHVMDGNEVTYLFERPSPVPAARFPNYQSASKLTVLFNERESHLQIASLDEFISSNGIHDYTLEPLEPGQLRKRLVAASPVAEETTTADTTEHPSVRGRQPSITLERREDPHGRLEESVGAVDIARSLNEAGFRVAADDVRLESPIKEFGLFKVPVQIDPETEERVFVWVVPAVVPPTGTR